MKSSIAIVTGGASGLGYAIAKTLSQNNFHVIIFDLDDNNFSSFSEAFDCHKVDVTQEEEIINAVEKVFNKYGQINVLINNAGLIYNAPLLNLMNPQKIRHSYDGFKKVLDVNLNSVFLMTSIVAEKMVMKRVKGNIINMSSICAQGNAGQSAYAAAKAGIEAMTKVWSKELGPFGIRSNVIAPGFIETPSTVAALNKNNIDKIIKNTPLKRLGKIENITKVILHTIENDFVNGSVIDIDGGLVI